jgi:hypothetical protein
MQSGWTDKERINASKLSPARLILKRFVLKLSDRIWSGWLSMILFVFLLGLIMYVLSFYECPVRRALGYPLSRSKNVATAFYAHPWEQDCEGNSAKP